MSTPIYETEFIDRLFLVIDQRIAELSQITQATTARESDLAMLVRRLAHRLEKVSPGDTVAAQANDFLRRKGLQGSVLREETGV